MNKLPIYLSMLFLLTCAKDDSQDPNTPPTQIVKQYALTASAGEGGSVTGGGTFSSGTQVSLTATPNSGYSFSGWSNGSSDNPLTITLNSNTTITANFQVIVNSYTLTVTAGEGGSVSTEGGEYEEGTEVTITATPEEGYEFIGWSDGSTKESLTINITEDISIVANFEIITYTTTFEDFISPFLNNKDFSFGDNFNLNQYDKALWTTYSFWYNDREIAPLNEYSMGQSYLTKDFNNDGFTDLFINFFSTENQFVPFKLFIYDNSLKKFQDFSQNIINNVGQPFGRKSMGADLNGDQILDIISVSHPEKEEKEFSYFDILYSNENTWQQFNIETRSRISEDISLGGYYHGFAIGDIDNDLDVDIVMGMWHNTQEGMTTYLNDGFGNFEKFKSINMYNPNDFDKETMSFTLELINLNNDDCLDLVFWGSSNTVIKKGNCNGTFGPDYTELENNLAQDFKGIDLDNDLDNDLIVYRDDYQGNKSFYVYENKSELDEIIFSSPIIYQAFPDSFDSSYFSLMDINNDGRLDIIPAGPLAGGNNDLLDGIAYPFSSPRGILISKGNLLFEPIKYPIVSPIEKIEYLNDENKISWMTMFLQDNLNVSNYDENNLRGTIKEWFIYYSDEPFLFSNDLNISKITINNDNIEFIKDPNNMTIYKYDFSSFVSDNLYIRIGFKDSFDIESNLSYLIKLSAN